MLVLEKKRYRHPYGIRHTARKHHKDISIRRYVDVAHWSSYRYVALHLSSVLQQKIGLVPMPGTSFLVQYYPVKMLFSDFLAVGVMVVFISLLAAYLPARKAALSVEKEYLSHLS